MGLIRSKLSIGMSSTSTIAGVGRHSCNSSAGSLRQRYLTGSWVAAGRTAHGLRRIHGQERRRPATLLSASKSTSRGFRPGSINDAQSSGQSVPASDSPTQWGLALMTQRSEVQIRPRYNETPSQGLIAVSATGLDHFR